MEAALHFLCHSIDLLALLPFHSFWISYFSPHIFVHVHASESQKKEEFINRLHGISNDYSWHPIHSKLSNDVILILESNLLDKHSMISIHFLLMTDEKTHTSSTDKDFRRSGF